MEINVCYRDITCELRYPNKTAKVSRAATQALGRRNRSCQMKRYRSKPRNRTRILSPKVVGEIRVSR